MKKELARLLMALLAIGFIMYSCQNDEMLSKLQTQDNGVKVEQILKSADAIVSCIDLNNPVYLKESLTQEVTWGPKKNPFKKTVTIVFYNTENEFVIEVMSTNGWANLIINGKSVWTDGQVAENIWGICHQTLPEGWTAGDPFNLNIKVTGNGPQARFDLSYNLVGVCSTAYGTMVDNEGNIYETVTIGELEWMRKNLRTLTFNNGDSIPTGFTDEEWKLYAGPAGEVYNPMWIEGIENKEEVLDKYGALYNFKAVIDPRGLCPEGWRIPSVQDWEQLIAYVSNIDNVAVGNQLKSCRQQNSPLGGECNTTEHPFWIDWDGINFGTDTYGFSAIPGGWRNEIGGFGNLGYEAHYWTDNEIFDRPEPRAHAFGMRAELSEIYKFDAPLSWAYSVRFVRNKQ